MLMVQGVVVKILVVGFLSINLVFDELLFE